MLDIDTLNSLHDLMARTLYRAEVTRLPALSRAEERTLVEQARRGEKGAQVALILSCLPRVFFLAVSFVLAYRPAHEDALDLAQTASVEMLMGLERALGKTNPLTYLYGIARKAMVIQTTYYGGLIRKPHVAPAQLAGMVPTVESLDTPAYRDGTLLKVDLITVPEPDGQSSEEREAARDRRFAPLYQALASLTERERATVMKHYGLGPYDEKLLYRGSGSYPGRYALDKLRRALEGHLTQMLAPQGNEDA